MQQRRATVAAAPRAVTFAGTGRYSTGLPCVGCAVTADFTMVGDGFGPCPVHLDGTTTGNLAGENGSGTLSGCVTGTLTWSRTGPVHTVSGRNYVNSLCFCYSASAGAWAAFDTSPTVTSGFLVAAAVSVPC